MGRQSLTVNRTTGQCSTTKPTHCHRPRQVYRPIASPVLTTTPVKKSTTSGSEDINCNRFTQSASSA